ncbi:preprotein translocase subunit SecA [Babesia caballi]|uniref:Preprotein translocase subunit SecA n=1 Tax=Babesia caballi TaxID=5871 RepID=A0AAV4LSF8_BABCB|nr:preprotein translocase subunit SecA [Babesia caballi]
MIPCEPTPTGMWSNMDCTSLSFTGSTSLRLRFVRMRRTPQLMSKPTPPGDTTALGSLISNAATFPIEKPYPAPPCTASQRTFTRVRVRERDAPLHDARQRRHVGELLQRRKEGPGVRGVLLQLLEQQLGECFVGEKVSFHVHPGHEALFHAVQVPRRRVRLYEGALRLVARTFAHIKLCSL